LKKTIYFFLLFSSFVYAQSISPSQIGSTILGNSDDRFGFSISLSDQGNTLVVGAPYDSNFKGKIYVYKLIDGNGNQSNSGVYAFRTN